MSENLPDGFVFRPMEPSDVKAVLKVIRDYNPDDHAPAHD